LRSHSIIINTKTIFKESTLHVGLVLKIAGEHAIAIERKVKTMMLVLTPVLGQALGGRAFYYPFFLEPDLLQ